MTEEQKKKWLTWDWTAVHTIFIACILSECGIGVLSRPLIAIPILCCNVLLIQKIKQVNK